MTRQTIRLIYGVIRGNFSVNEIKNKICMVIVSWLPNRIIFYSAIKLMAYASTGGYKKQIVTDLTVLDALGRYERDHDIGE